MFLYSTDYHVIFSPWFPEHPGCNPGPRDDRSEGQAHNQSHSIQTILQVRAHSVISFGGYSLLCSDLQRKLDIQLKTKCRHFQYHQRLQWRLITICFFIYKEKKKKFISYKVWVVIWFLCPRHSKNGGGALSVTLVCACVRPSVLYQNLVSAQ